MDGREMADLSAKIENGFKALEAKVDGELAAIKAELKTVATSNAKGIVDVKTAANADPAYGNAARTIEVLASGDVYKGKGLMFARCIRAFAMAEKFGEQKMALAKKLGVPEDLMKRALDIDGSVEKSLGESTLAGGGVLVPDQFSMEFIELLRANVVLINNGVTRIPMTSKTLTIGRQAGAATAGWVGESQNITKSEQTFDDIQLDLKKLACLTPVSNDLLRDNVIAADIIIRNDLLAIATREMDLKAMRGLGTQYSPRGFRNLLTSTQLFNSAAAGTGSLTSALADLNKAIRVTKEGNVPFTKQTAFWIMSPRTEYGYRQYRDGVGRPFFGEEMDSGKLIGYNFFTTTAVPNNLSGGGSGGSTESEVYFVVGPEFYLGEGLTPTIEVARNAAYYDGSAVQSGLSRDETAVSVILRVDFKLRHNVSGSCVKGIIDA